MPGPRNGAQNGNGEQVLQRLLVVLEQVQSRIGATQDDYLFLINVLQNRDLQALVQIHNCITKSGKERQPVVLNAVELVDEILESLSEKTHLREVEELQSILLRPHIQAVLTAHDQVAQKDYYPKLPDIPHEVDEDEETVKIVQLVKSNEPLFEINDFFKTYIKPAATREEPLLGATIKVDTRTGTIVIARIMHGGAADRSGLINVGDEVHEVNGTNVRGKTPADVLRILEVELMKWPFMDGTITFKLIPSDGKLHARESKVRVRVHFDYNPKEDREIPCRDAGLVFHKGDVLHIVNQDDPNWWQARREGDRNVRAGLIPGRLLQERRLLAQRNVDVPDEEDIIPICRSPGSTIKKSTKTKKIMYELRENDDYDREEIPTYEEVARLYPRHGIFRPIILLGPPGVGRNELKRRLIATEPDLFKTTIPHTSRPRKPNEIEGKDYYFVSRESMEEDIKLGRLVEHGEYKGNLYGTSIEMVKAIVEAGYICVMNPHPQALKMLRTPELKPYVIFVKPPPFQRFKETRQNLHARSTFDENCSRGFTEDELEEIIRSAERIEFLYGHCFDATIVNEDLVETFELLLSIVRRVEVEPHWVPASWVN